MFGKFEVSPLDTYTLSKIHILQVFSIYVTEDSRNHIKKNI